MFKEIYDYGLSNPLIKKDKVVEKTGTISAYIWVDENGKYQRLEILDKKIKNNAKIPDVGNWASNSAKEKPFVNSVNKVIPNWNNEKSTLTAHEVWLKYMKEAIEFFPELNPLKIFLNTFEKDEDLQINISNELRREGIDKENYNVSFKINGNYILNIINWQDFILKLISVENKNNNGEYISSITGERYIGIPTPDIINANNDNAIEGFSKANTGSGVFIASYKQDSFKHYGLNGNDGKETIHFSQKESDVITNTIVYLVSSPDHYNSNFDLVYWYDQGIPDLIGSSLSFKDGTEEDDDFSDENNKRNEANVVLRKLLSAAIEGTTPREHFDAKYFMFNFEVPSKGRCLLYNMKIGDYSKLSSNLFKWYRDSRLEISLGKNGLTDKCLTNFYRILLVLLEHDDTNNKFDQIDKEFGRNKNCLLSCIYENKKIPKIFIDKAIRKCTKATMTGSKIPIEAVQLLKVNLCRKEKMSPMDNKLNKEHESSAYQLGRYFAICEKLQYVSSNGTTNTIGSYFDGVQKAPSRMYLRLAKLSKVYVKKLKEYNNFYNSLLSEVGSKIINLPMKFKIDEKAEFILGYYQQNVDLYKKANKEEK